MPFEQFATSIVFSPENGTYYTRSEVVTSFVFFTSFTVTITAKQNPYGASFSEAQQADNGVSYQAANAQVSNYQWILDGSTARYIGLEQYVSTASDDGFNGYFSAGLTINASYTVDVNGFVYTSGSGTYSNTGSSRYRADPPDPDITFTLSTSYTLAPPSILFDALPFYETTLTSVFDYPVKTSITSVGTFYGPLEESSTTYTATDQGYTFTSFSDVKTTKTQQNIFVGPGDIDYYMQVEWLGLGSDFGGQEIALINLNTNSIINAADYYDAVLVQADITSATSFSYALRNETFGWSVGSFDSIEPVFYTLTYDNTFSTLINTTTTSLITNFPVLEKNYFTYSFIKASTFTINIASVSTTSFTAQFVSNSQDNPFVTLDETFLQNWRLSYTYVQIIDTVQTISTPQFFEISGLNKLTSFGGLRRTHTITALKVYKANAQYAITGGGSWSLNPASIATGISYLYKATDFSYYTERAYFGSFADPDNESVFNMYSPADGSNVLLALIPLKDTAEQGKYPSYISVYAGSYSLANDRAETSLQSVTINQESSYQSVGATNVYQTINYFIGNNSNSSTTKTSSVALRLVDSVGSVSRFVRTTAENLDSAYINSYLPSIALYGPNVVFTRGLQGGAGYKVEGLLLNNYNSANPRTIVDESTTYFFPASITAYPVTSPFQIIQVYGEPSPSSRIPLHTIDLLRYSNSVL